MVREGSWAFILYSFVSFFFPILTCIFSSVICVALFVLILCMSLRFLSSFSVVLEIFLLSTPIPLMRSTKYHIPSEGVTKETKFYDDAETAHNDIEKFRERLRFRNDEFDKLMEYYQQHRGTLDVYHRPINGPRAMRPNLGSKDETWYYLDGAGNKIWVRNVELDTSDPNCGAFLESGKTHAGGDGDPSKDHRIVVVRIPKVRHNYNVQLDYRKKLAEYDASYRLPQCSRTVAQQHHQQQHEEPLTWPSAGHGGSKIEAYIATQKRLAEGLQQRPRHNNDRDELLVWRPPASLEEAEARLAALKREAAEIESQRKQSSAAISSLH